MIDDAPLLAALGESHRFGALGETPEVALQHSVRFVAALGAARSVLDLGSGGGVPGLVIAWRRPDVKVTLLDRRTARTDLLQRLVAKMGIADRVEVVASEAEAAGRSERYRSRFDVVTCRSFAGPLETLRLSRPFLADGSRILVAEPPGSPDRWREDLATFPIIADQGVQDGIRTLRCTYAGLE